MYSYIEYGKKVISNFERIALPLSSDYVRNNKKHSVIGDFV